MENLVIEAVSNKFANKYNAGSVLANGKWYQVSTKLNLSDFRKGESVSVETKTNDKGYTSITGFSDMLDIKNAQAEEAFKSVVTESKGDKRTKALIAEMSEKVQDKTLRELKASTMTSSDFQNREDTKNKRILVQGIVQAVIQSPFMVNHTKDDAAEVAIEVALKLIKFTIDQTK